MLLLSLVLFLASDLTAQVPTTLRAFSPVVSGSIHDEPRDGFGDTFNSFTGLLREQATREDRAIQEFDLTGVLPTDVLRATLRATVSVNNAFNNGTRSFDFLLYPGNGALDLTDFEIPGVIVGSGSYAPPTDSSFSVAIDVTSNLQSLLASGSNLVGLRVDPTSSPNFPNLLDAGTTLEIELVAADAISVGVGCGANTMDPPDLDASQPVLGSTLDIDVSECAPGTQGLLYFSFGAPVGVALPGVACTIEVDFPNAFLLTPFTTDANGEFNVSFPLAAAPGVAGSEVTLQAVVFPTTGPLGVDLTSGLLLRFGY